MKKTDQRAPILIAGAGIGGLSAAILLRRAGFEVEVFERAPEVRELGAGISLWMNAMHALRLLGVEDDIRRVSAPFDRSEVLSWKGRRLRRFSIAGLAQALRAEPVGIGRPELLQALHRACADIPVHTSSCCVGFTQDEEGVTLRLSDGREARGSVLVGADGMRSAIRSQLIGDEAVYAGQIEWRGISATNQGAEAERGSLFMVLGPGSTSGVGWYVDETRVSWSVGYASPQPGGPELRCNREAVLQRLAGWRGPLRSLVANTPSEQIHLSNHRFRPVARQWGEGRVTLLGDSAHPMSTIFGQGGAQTLEDAVVLADSLVQREGDLATGLRLYEKQRSLRVRFVIRQVQEAVRLLSLHRATPPGSWMRALAIRFLPPGLMLEKIRRIMTVSEGASA